MKTSKSGDEGSAQPNKNLKTSKSIGEGSAQAKKAPSNTTNQRASEKTETSTTNTGDKDPAVEEPVSSNNDTQLVGSDAEAFLLHVKGKRKTA